MEEKQPRKLGCFFLCLSSIYKGIGTYFNSIYNNCSSSLIFYFNRNTLWYKAIYTQERRNKILTHQVKININNIKKEVNKHYFKYRDIFYRILITNICIYNTVNGNMLQNTIIEDSSYNQYFLYLANKQLSLKELLLELNISEELHLYMDLSIYIDEFLQLKHVNDRINVYSISIADNGYLVIDNKKLDKGILNVQS